MSAELKCSNYNSVYKSDFQWPPLYPISQSCFDYIIYEKLNGKCQIKLILKNYGRSEGEVNIQKVRENRQSVRLPINRGELFQTFPDHCREEKPKEPCVCQELFCICQQKKRHKDDVVTEVDPKDLVYLKGVKTVYQDTFSHGSEVDSGILANDPCPRLNTPITSIWNPYLVPKDAFRPGQPRPLGCPLTFESVTRPVDYNPTIKRSHQINMCDINDLLTFPQNLQEKIVRSSMKQQKISICRERPRATRNLL